MPTCYRPPSYGNAIQERTLIAQTFLETGIHLQPNQQFSRHLVGIRIQRGRRQQMHMQQAQPTHTHAQSQYKHQENGCGGKNKIACPVFTLKPSLTRDTTAVVCCSYWGFRQRLNRDVLGFRVWGLGFRVWGGEVACVAMQG